MIKVHSQKAAKYSIHIPLPEKHSFAHKQSVSRREINEHRKAIEQREYLLTAYRVLSSCSNLHQNTMCCNSYSTQRSLLPAVAGKLPHNFAETFAKQHPVIHQTLANFLLKK